MEEGSLRCDGNVSPAPPRHHRVRHQDRAEEHELASRTCTTAWPTRSAVRPRCSRRAAVIYQETRHWDPSAKRTIVMRVKETADDYRLFPEPDLAPYDLTDEFIEGVRAKLPELPDQKAARFAADVRAHLLRRAPFGGAPRHGRLFRRVHGARERRGRRRQVRQAAREPHHQRRGRVAERPRGRAPWPTPRSRRLARSRL